MTSPTNRRRKAANPVAVHQEQRLVQPDSGHAPGSVFNENGRYVLYTLNSGDAAHMTKLLKNILNGAGSVVDVWPSTGDRVQRDHPFKSDADALRNDWLRVGNDIANAIEKEKRVQTQQ
jgi:hypothetical protein